MRGLVDRLFVRRRGPTRFGFRGRSKVGRSGIMLCRAMLDLLAVRARLVALAAIAPSAAPSAPPAPPLGIVALATRFARLAFICAGVLTVLRHRVRGSLARD